jgi:hypothetical protein
VCAGGTNKKHTIFRTGFLEGRRYVLINISLILTMDYFLVLAYLIIGFIVHRLAHKLMFLVFGIKSRFIWFFEGKGISKLCGGLRINPLNYDYSVKKQYIISIAGFVGSVIVSLIFYIYMNSFLELVILIVYPILLSIIDFITIIRLIGKPLNVSVKEAMKP